MANQEHKNENNTSSVSFWLPIGAGVGAALGAAMATVTGQLGTFAGVGVAAGMMLVAFFAILLRKRS